jgi:hypothetical protein
MAVATPAMRVARRLDLDWHGEQLSVAHSALCGDVLSEMTNVVHRAAQNCDLEAALVVEMHMHRRQRQIVVVVKRAGEPLGERATFVIVDINERGDTLRIASERFW